MTRIRKRITMPYAQHDASASPRLRPASVLILVIVLLVLMALLGTAYLVTARNDRVATRVYSENVQIDMLLDGVEKMSLKALSDRSYQTSNVQRYDDYTTLNPSNDPNFPSPVDHSWMAARIPMRMSDAMGNLPQSGTPLYPCPKGVMVTYGGNGMYLSLLSHNTGVATDGASWATLTNAAPQIYNTMTPVWPAISGPLLANGFFEDPRNQGVRPDYSRTMMAPTSTSIAGVTYPAMTYYSYVTNKVETCLAASASGDGIADSLLWRLPIGTVDGITYYAAVRIIDNGSAININTANSSSTDFDNSGNHDTQPGAAAFLSCFPSGIGLAELTNSYQAGQLTDTTMSSELTLLNQYRFNFPLTNMQRPGVGVGSSPVNDPSSSGGTGTSRSDFIYINEGDALYNILGRRVNNPGMVATTAQARAFSWSDSEALAYRFDLRNAYATPGAAETALSASTNTASTSPWPTANVNGWFQQYDETITGAPGNAPKNRRAYFVPHNPLSNLMPARNLMDSNNVTHLTNQAGTAIISTYMIGGYTQYLTNQAIPKVSLDTADITAQDAPIANNGSIPESPPLWLGFYSAMLDAFTVNPNILTVKQGSAQFRSPIRDLNGFGQTAASATTYFSGPETMLFRSLLASVNAKDLRDSGDNATAYNPPGILNFPATVNGGAGTVSVYPYGTERQVFITEIYASNEPVAPMTLGAGQRPDPDANLKNPKGYVAVEIYNPYDYPVDMTNWTLGVAQRKSGSLKVAPITSFKGFGNDGQNAVVPPKSYLVLENFPGSVASQSANDATYRPYAHYAGSSPPTVNYYVPNLHEVMTDASDATTTPGGELLLLRPTFAHGLLGPVVGALTNPIPLNILALLPAADSIDFTGMTTQTPGTTKVTEIHYVRANPGNAQPTPQTAWKFVYPGRWDPKAYAPYYQEGVQTSAYDPASKAGGNFSTWADAPPAGPTGATPIALGALDTIASYANPFGAIQLNNTDMGGPNKLLTNQEPARFPYGGFARVGDVLQTPYFASSLIVNPAGDNSAGTQILEINSVTRDCANADDNDGGVDDAIEQVGRFCPLSALDVPGKGPAYGIDPKYPDYYGWASHVFDYFTAIQNPHDDYLPNIEPDVYKLGPWDMPTLTYPGTSAGGVATPVPNVINSGGGPNRGFEDTVPIEGLININTASWRALAAVPWFPTADAASITANNQVAKSIASFRNTYGPFKTLFDLNKIASDPYNSDPLVKTFPGFQNYMGDPTSAYFSYAQGNISPLNPTPSGATSDFVTGDFENRFAMITRVSNMITTRSDTYTVYVLVQGWSGVGTTNPQIVVQRRGAFIADRSQLTAANPTVGVYKIPTAN